MYCDAWPDLQYLFFTSHVPELFYYSHIPTTIIALIVGGTVVIKKRSLVNYLLLALAISFSLWTFFNLILWTSPNSGLLTFLWSLYGMIIPAIFLTAGYFAYVFIKKRDMPLAGKLVFLLAALPLILFHDSNVAGFDLTNCEALEGAGFNLYGYPFNFVIFFSILIFGIREYVREKSAFRNQIALVTAGVSMFLLLFFSTGFLASYLAEQGYEHAFELEQYGLFGMTFFIAVLGYLIVRYHAFDIKMLATQALVFGLVALVGSEFFFVETTTNTVLVAVTFVLTCVGGYFLIQSVKKEVKQREEIAELAETLRKANERLKILDKMKSEFVSIASHQLRSPLTAIRGYASMLLEGSYGALGAKMTEAVQRIADSSRYMALSVEDYLNVSRIEAGNMKYEYSDFNLKETAEKIVDEMRPAAMAKGLVLLFRSDCGGSCSVHADVGKVRQAVMNLIDNAMKYTPKGSIDVVAHDDVAKKKMLVTIKDTGVGMSKETLDDLFNKFVRAKNANEINVTGTGLGLFVAKKMIEEMGGRIFAESQGEGQGSSFHIELPLLPGNSVR